LAIYWQGARPTGPKRTATIGFAILLVLATLATPFTPPPTSAAAFAHQALFFYLLLAGLAAWVDRRPDAA
jgi:predicted membrane metal-binding protein